MSKATRFKLSLFSLTWERGEEPADEEYREVDMIPAHTERLPEEIYEEARDRRSVGFAPNGVKRTFEQ